MQAVAVEASGTDRPPFLHPRASAGPSGLLPWAENAPGASRHQPRDRAAVSGDDVLCSGLDVANTSCKRLVGFTKADRLAHPRRILLEMVDM